MGNRRVLITAGASGIGRAMGEAFAAAGWQVWVSDLDDAALADCPAEWRRTRANAAEESEVAALFATIASDWGGLDALCANAGVAGPTAAVEDVALAEWRACVAVNLQISKRDGQLNHGSSSLTFLLYFRFKHWRN